ncbi:MAG: cation-translocating P-type ATPase [Cyanophyceae cyanobacterium]|mgnify:CR=1 FL=1
MAADTASSVTVAKGSTRWHTLSGEAVLARLESDSEVGLTLVEARSRTKQFGPNEIQDQGGRSGWQILIEQFQDIMLLLLIGVAFVSAGLDIYEGMAAGSFPFPKDAIAIFTIVFLNAVLGYVQESRAEKALAALKQLSSPRVRVLRDGEFGEVDARELVPGDVMVVEAGSQVAADGRILEAVSFQVQEAALTGEAQGVDKSATEILEDDAALGDRINLVFQGTEATYGRAKILVTNTGMTTELGKIAAMIQGVESEETPLQQRMNQLGNVLVLGSMTLVALVMVVGTIGLGFGAFRQLLEVSLSMAVAVVPEGLPAVITVTLALGTQRMVRRQALIRKLPAVETLGSVTTICSDKTGTLTQNKMVVQTLELAGRSWQITGEGYDPFGLFYRVTDQDLAAQGRSLPPNPEAALAPATLAQQHPDLQLLLVAAVLCNDAVLRQMPADNGQKSGGAQGKQNKRKKSAQGKGDLVWGILGDPTEGGLLALAGKANIVQEVWSRQFPRVAEIPFSSDRKRMSVFVKTGGTAPDDRLFPLLPLQTAKTVPGFLMWTKGSPELVLQGCDFVQQGSRVVPLSEGLRSRIMDNNDRLAGEGLRVLGFAYRCWDRLPHETGNDNPESELIWLGLVGMIDAARPEAAEAVKRCRRAGIRPVMITGDHRLTARAIAQQLGICDAGDRVLTGKELEPMTDAELETEAAAASVYARVSPEHKLRIVKALQRQGRIVAMTGDGVNDAPALKQANIGIAMGITGTDVSKEASDMVLLDDNFTSIVAATEEGRVVYDNIRRFVKYILGSNIGEVLTIAAAPMVLPAAMLSGNADLVPLSPLQILWMNLVTDGLPALALAVEPSTPDMMERPPHPPEESIFARGLGFYMVRIGIVFAITTVLLMLWAYDHANAAEHLQKDSWKTMVFTTLCVSQMGHAIAVRSDRKLIIEMDLFSNPYILWSVLVTIVLQFILVYVPPISAFFGTVPLDGLELLVCLGVSALVLLWIEGEKLFFRWFWRRKS